MSCARSVASIFDNHDLLKVLQSILVIDYDVHAVVSTFYLPSSPISNQTTISSPCPFRSLYVWCIEGRAISHCSCWLFEKVLGEMFVLEQQGIHVFLAVEWSQVVNCPLSAVEEELWLDKFEVELE